MTWLAWHQFRAQAAAGAAALAVLVFVLLIVAARATGLHDAGEDLLGQLASTQRLAYGLGTAFVLLAPAIVGVFWGAPLVARELEAGTHRLAWAQTISRTRWLVTKLVIGGLATAAVIGIASLAVTWWCGPIDRAVDAGGDQGGLFVARVAPLVFDARGAVPVGHALFAFALGVTAGLLMRRTLPAMALTLALFVAVLVATPMWVRPHLVAPARVVAPIPVDTPVLLTGDGAVLQTRTPGGWQLSRRIVDADDHGVALPAWFASCAENATTSGTRSCIARLNREGYRQQITYQPAGHFWRLQLAETGIFLVLAVALAGGCVRRIAAA